MRGARMGRVRDRFADRPPCSCLKCTCSWTWPAPRGESCAGGEGALRKLYKLQAEPNKKATSVRPPALLACVFSRLAVFVCAKNSILPKEQKKFQPNRSERSIDRSIDRRRRRRRRRRARTRVWKRGSNVMRRGWCGEGTGRDRASERASTRSIATAAAAAAAAGGGGGGGGRARAFGRVSRHHGVSLLPLPLAPISPHVSRSMPHAAHTSRAALFVAASFSSTRTRRQTRAPRPRSAWGSSGTERRPLSFIIIIQGQWDEQRGARR